MSPGTISIEPDTSNQLKQAYKDGFEAGKASIRRELKELLNTLNEKEPQTHTSSSTYTNLFNL